MICLLLCLVLAVGSTAAAASPVLEAGAAGGHSAAHGVADAACDGADCDQHHVSEPCVQAIGHCATALLPATRDILPAFLVLEARLGFGGNPAAVTRLPETETPPPRA